MRVSCGFVMRHGGICVMPKDHRGPHSSSAYLCDGCSKVRRGRPWRYGPEGLGFCFLCCLEDNRNTYHDS